MRARESIGSHASAGLTLLMGLLAFATACGAQVETYAFEERRFSVAAARENGGFVISVEPRAPWKIAVEFPFELRMRVDGGDENRRDKEAAEERTEGRLRYAVPVPHNARSLGGVVVFGVCRGPICERVTHAFTLPTS